MFELPFKVKNYKEIKDLYILGDTSEVVANLDDSLVTINTVLSSRYVGGIRGMVDEWRGKLVTLQVCTKRRWSLLVSIIVRQTTNAKLLPCRNFPRPLKSEASLSCWHIKHTSTASQRECNSLSRLEFCH